MPHARHGNREDSLNHMKISLACKPHVVYDLNMNNTATQTPTFVEHAMTTERAWADYGQALSNSPDVWGEFLWLWANLKNHPSGAQFDHRDYNRFWNVFKGAADKSLAQRKVA